MFVIKNKVVQQQDTPLFSGMLPVDIQEEKEGQPIKFLGGKITRVQWDQVKSFLRWSQHQFKGESQIRMFYNKEQRTWEMHPFEQYISTTLSTTEVKDSEKNNSIVSGLLNRGFVCMGTTHHHCTAGAFQSGTDYNDEVTQNGLHITLGNMESPVFGFHSRVSFRGLMYTAELPEWFEEDVDLTADIGIESFPVEWKDLLVARVAPVTTHYPAVNNNWNSNYYKRPATTYGGWDDWDEDDYMRRYFPEFKERIKEQKALEDHVKMMIEVFELGLANKHLQYPMVNKIIEIINTMDDFSAKYKDNIAGENDFREFLGTLVVIIDAALLDDPYKVMTKSLTKVIENTIWLRHFADLSIAEYLECEEDYYAAKEREEEFEDIPDTGGEEISDEEIEEIVVANQLAKELEGDVEKT